MKINTAPANSAEMSGVLETKQFTIKTSSHAFQILSSGLYANKIRAIIRELSCNAYDSHVSAGKKDIPFDVHLPTTLEPYFSVRDYGIGLSHEQVVTIFTTYFESTKTDSNDLIGGLGLGSKAPFSYTENFTVTAIKNGVKGVYSAYVSDVGTPSIAMMSRSETDEINGVEIQFAVENAYDFRKFYDEAQHVFQSFKTVPNFTGHTIAVQPREYETRNVAPGIHLCKRKHKNIAVMGNIAYPIDVPNADKLLKELVAFDSIGLEIEFDIGEIEFQASREGLSYTPQTIQAICKKYEMFAASLEPAFLKRVLQCRNTWERAWFIQSMLRGRIWQPAAKNYIDKAKYPFVTKCGNTVSFELDPDHLVAHYNIRLDKLPCRWGYYSKTVRLETFKKKDTIALNREVRFLINEKNRKLVARIKEKVKSGNLGSVDMFYLLNPADPKKPMHVAEFFKLISNPPANQIMLESDFPAPPKVDRSGRTAQLIQLKHEYRSGEYRWENEYYEAEEVEGDGPFYYLPIKGFAATIKGKKVDTKDFVASAINSGILRKHAYRVFGVRSEALEEVQQDPRFKHLEDAIVEEMSTVGKQLIYGSLITSRVYNWIKTLQPDNPNSLFAEMNKKLVDNNTDLMYITKVCKHLDIDIEDVRKQAQQDIANFFDYYPLLKHLDSSIGEAAVKDYINLVDKSKE